MREFAGGRVQMPRQRMQTQIAQGVEPLPGSSCFRQDAFHEPSRLQSLQVAVDGGATRSSGHTHSQIISTLQRIALQPVEEPPIDLREGRIYLSRHCCYELASSATPPPYGLKHREPHLPPPHLRERMLLLLPNRRSEFQEGEQKRIAGCPTHLLLIDQHGQMHSRFIMSRQMASKLKVLPHHGRSKCIIKRLRFPRCHVVDHVQCNLVHLIHRHTSHVHPHRHNHEFMGNLPFICDHKMIGCSWGKGGHRRGDLVFRKRHLNLPRPRGRCSGGTTAPAGSQHYHKHAQDSQQDVDISSCLSSQSCTELE